ncbi:zinc finger, CCHC-type containing protein [Tanacetum coccineum]
MPTGEHITGDQNVRDSMDMLPTWKLQKMSTQDTGSLLLPVQEAGVLVYKHLKEITVRRHMISFEDGNPALATSHKLMVERFYTSAGNPVKEILLKLNLPDHRSILTDSKLDMESRTPVTAKANPPYNSRSLQQTLDSFLMENTPFSIDFLTPKHPSDITHSEDGKHAEPTSQELMFDESNAYMLERLYTSAGNPVNEILLKLNLSDHRILKDGHGVYTTNDSEDLGKLKPKADIGLVPNSAPSTSSNPPSKKELDILFQPVVHEYDVNPIRTLRDYSKPSHEGYKNTIELSVGNNVVPLQSDTIQLVQNGCSFHGLWSEDPNQHLKDFLKLVDSLDLDGGSITTWEDLTTRFLDQFFPPGRTAKLCNDILMFQQHHGGSLSKA